MKRTCDDHDVYDRQCPRCERAFLAVKALDKGELVRDASGEIVRIRGWRPELAGWTE